MGVGFSVDFFRKHEAVSTGFGQSDQLLKPCGSGGLEVYAGVEPLHGGVYRWIERKFVAAGVHAELEIAGKTEAIDRIGDGGNIQSKLVLELCEISLVVDTFIEATAEFRRNGLDGNAFVGDSCEDDEQLQGRLCAVGFIHGHFCNEVSFASRVCDDAI